MKGRTLTQWEIDALGLAILREMRQRVVRWVVFFVVAMVLMGTAAGMGVLIGLQAGG